ncbi:MAG: HAMP domain-containing histidine kinase [Clostridia bacterium]|nr:HAMP domain-containing histidine kinase [Clostridia bacterium]
MKKKEQKYTKSRELFQNLRKTKVGWFNLKTRLTMLIVAEALVFILIAFGLSHLITMLFPSFDSIPLFVQIAVLTLIALGVATRLFSRLFFDPIKQLREAMQRVADGDFSVRLDTERCSREIKEVNAGFNLMMEELSATEILQTDFVSNVSHEFKTPINAIEGYTTLLQDCANLSDEEQVYVEKILFNTKRLSTLVGNILLLSKIENQSIQTNRTRFRLDEQIRQSIVILEPCWSSKGIEPDAELENIEFTGNEALLHHVWDNIINNAIKFSPDNSCITVKLFREGSYIVFSVADSGPGLTEKAKKHIFDKFYQEDTSHKAEGNGLGLALVHRIITICDGAISAENREDGGAIFTVRLPQN